MIVNSNERIKNKSRKVSTDQINPIRVPINKHEEVKQRRVSHDEGI